jgi:phosphonate transport system substrate-binding protein
MPDYSSLIEAQATARVHYAVYSATAFVTASATCRCVDPIAVPTASGGEKGFHALLIARADGGVDSLADAKGARLALAGPDSVGGRLLQLRGLEAEGIVAGDHFSKFVDVADPEMAVTALLAGEADLAAAWSSLSGDAAAGYSFGVLAALVADGGLVMDQIRIVWQSELIPFGPHAVRTGLPGELKSLLSEALGAMSAEDPAALDAIDRSGGSGFVTADAGMFAAVEALVAPATPRP